MCPARTLSGLGAKLCEGVQWNGTLARLGGKCGVAVNLRAIPGAEKSGPTRLAYLVTGVPVRARLAQAVGNLVGRGGRSGVRWTSLAALSCVQVVVRGAEEAVRLKGVRVPVAGAREITRLCVGVQGPVRKARAVVDDHGPCLAIGLQGGDVCKGKRGARLACGCAGVLPIGASAGIGPDAPLVGDGSGGACDALLSRDVEVLVGGAEARSDAATAIVVSGTRRTGGTGGIIEVSIGTAVALTHPNTAGCGHETRGTRLACLGRHVQKSIGGARTVGNVASARRRCRCRRTRYALPGLDINVMVGSTLTLGNRGRTLRRRGSGGTGDTIGEQLVHVLVGLAIALGRGLGIDGRPRTGGARRAHEGCRVTGPVCSRVALAILALIGAGLRLGVGGAIHTRAGVVIVVNVTDTCRNVAAVKG